MSSDGSNKPSEYSHGKTYDKEGGKDRNAKAKRVSYIHHVQSGAELNVSAIGVSTNLL